MAKPILDCNSQALFQRAGKTIPGGVNSPVRAFEPNPFFVTHAKGSNLYSSNSKTYLDYCMAYGAFLLGHANPEILNAVSAQLPKGTLYGAPTELEVAFAELVQKIYPSMEMLRTVNTGTEATMHAIRAARGFTKRKKLVKFEGCFHGSHDSVLVKAGSGAATFGTPSSEGVPAETTQNTIVLPYNSCAALDEVFARAGSDIAAVIIEPVMGNAGLILPNPDYLSYLRKLTRKHGAVLIFDEIITGFRLAPGGAQEYFNVQPDLTTLGKVLGGGFPIAVFGGKKEIMQTISPSGGVYQAGTFSGNPISTTAAYTTLNLLMQKQTTLYPKLAQNCAELSKTLADLAANYHLNTQIISIASMFQIFFTPTPIHDMATAQTSNTSKFKIYFQELLKQGIFIPPSQFETCFLSTAHTDDDLAFTCRAFDQALHAVATKQECS